MQNHSQAFGLRVEQSERVGGRIAGVNHQCLVELFCELDVELEGVALRVARRAVAVVIESGLPNGHAARIGAVAAQLLLVKQLRVVRMAANRGEYRVVALGGGKRGRAAHRIGSHGHHPCHSCIRGGCEKLRKGLLAGREMCM